MRHDLCPVGRRLLEDALKDLKEIELYLLFVKTHPRTPTAERYYNGAVEAMERLHDNLHSND